ncbi:MAG: PQQ-binding-like beta-propeller repeat protein [Verrucomicrobia bacterium]|nr:PQQ-binding-like beta-propeller repeat protein [Verrucomicrobiota bacterium]
MNPLRKMLLYVNTAAVFLLRFVDGAAENWPGFRGPTRQGLSAETGLPLKWSATENVAWKTEIAGEAWSSPIVWNDHVFVTTATDQGTTCRVLAIDRDSGRVLWNKEIFSQVTLRKERRNSYATPTPVTDGKLVFAVFGDGSFAALDFRGGIVWVNRDFTFYSQHGLGTSPILWEDLLIMARDASSEGEDKKVGWQIPWEKSFVVALDKNTGAVRWKTGRGMSRIGHVVPNIWRDPSGRAQIISGAGDVVQGFDARSGELIWTSENKGEGVVPSIVLGDGVAFTACGWGGRESIRTFRLGGQGDLKETNLAWEQRKAVPKIPSYLYLKPHLFTITEGGIVMCLNEATGEIIWQERISGNFSASPVAVEGRIYCLSDEGETTIIEAGPQFKVLAKNPLNEKVQASMAISGKRLFIRTETNLYCIGVATTVR